MPGALQNQKRSRQNRVHARGAVVRQDRRRLCADLSTHCGVKRRREPGPCSRPGTLGTDPLGFADGPNLYRYAGNDPINYRDPSGLSARKPTDNVFSGLVSSTRSFVNASSTTLNFASRYIQTEASKHSSSPRSGFGERLFAGLVGQAAGVVASGTSQFSANLSGRQPDNSVFTASTITNSRIGSVVDFSSPDSRVRNEVVRRSAAGITNLFAPNSAMTLGIDQPLAQTPTDRFNISLRTADSFSANNGQLFAPAFDAALDLTASAAGGAGAFGSFTSSVARQGVGSAVRQTVSRNLANFDAGNVPSHDTLLLGRMESVNRRAREGRGFVSETRPGAPARETFKKNFSDIRRAEQIEFDLADVPKTQAELLELQRRTGKRGGAGSRAELEMILRNRPELRLKTEFINE